MGKGDDPNGAAALAHGAVAAMLPCPADSDTATAGTKGAEQTSSNRLGLIGDIEDLPTFRLPGDGSEQEARAVLIGEAAAANAVVRRPLPPALRVIRDGQDHVFLTAYSANPALQRMLPFIELETSAGERVSAFVFRPATEGQALGTSGVDQDGTDVGARCLIAVWQVMVTSDLDGWGVAGYKDLAERITALGVSTTYAEARDAGREFERRFGLALRFEKKGSKMKGTLRTRLHVPTDRAGWQGPIDQHRAMGESTRDGGHGLGEALRAGAWFLTKNERAAGLDPREKQSETLNRITGWRRHDAERIVRMLERDKSLTGKQMIERLRQGSEHWGGGPAAARAVADPSAKVPEEFSDHGAKLRELIRTMRVAGVPVVGAGALGYKLVPDLKSAIPAVASLTERGDAQVSRAERLDQTRAVFLPADDAERRLRERLVATAELDGGIQKRPDPKRRANAEAKQAAKQERAMKREQARKQRAARRHMQRCVAAEDFLRRSQPETDAVIDHIRTGGKRGEYERDLFDQREAARVFLRTGKLPRGHAKRKYRWYELPSAAGAQTTPSPEPELVGAHGTDESPLLDRPLAGTPVDDGVPDWFSA